MATITSAGIGSGIEVEGLITDLLRAEAEAESLLLDSKEKDITLQLSGYASLKSAASIVESSAAKLSLTTTYTKLTATSADAAVFTASASTGATQGSYGIEVLSLAVADRKRSAYFDSSTSTVATGSLTITSGVTTFSVEIDSENQTLTSIKDAINDATGNDAIDATILTTDQGSSLVLSTRNTGVSNAISISGSGDLENFADQIMDSLQMQSSQVAATATTLLGEADASTLTITLSGGATTSPEISIDSSDTLTTVRDKINSNSDINSLVTASLVSTEGGYSLLISNNDPSSSQTITVSGTATLASTFSSASYTIEAASDASIEIDDQVVTSSTNKFENAIQNVTIVAASVSTASEKTKLTVGPNTENIKQEVMNFVENYNTLFSAIGDLTSYNAVTDTAGILLGDSISRNINVSMRRFLSETQSLTTAQTVRTLSDLGVETQRDGTLELNLTELDSALSNNLDEVQSLFSDTDSGIATQIERFLETFVDLNGIFDQKTESLQSSIADINSKRESISLRLTKIEENLRSQFINMDLIVGNLRSQGTFLTQQFDNLPGFSKSD